MYPEAAVAEAAAANGGGGTAASQRAVEGVADSGRRGNLRSYWDIYGIIKRNWLLLSSAAMREPRSRKPPVVCIFVYNRLNTAAFYFIFARSIKSRRNRPDTLPFEFITTRPTARPVTRILQTYLYITRPTLSPPPPSLLSSSIRTQYLHFAPTNIPVRRTNFHSRALNFPRLISI